MSEGAPRAAAKRVARVTIVYCILKIVIGSCEAEVYSVNVEVWKVIVRLFDEETLSWNRWGLYTSSWRLWQS
jgi:hypothetical protein